MNNTELDFEQDSRQTVQDTSVAPGLQSGQQYSNSFLQQSNQLTRAPPVGLSLNAMSLSAFLTENPSQGSLGSSINNDMRLQQIQQQLAMGQTGNMIHHHHQPQQTQPQIFQQHQPQANNELLRSLMSSKIQVPSYEEQLQLRQRFLTSPSSPMLQSPLLSEAQLIMQSNNNNNFIFSSLTGQNIPLPSPHELTLKDDTRRMRGGVIEPFPEKLHRLLTEVEAIGLADVISFIADGKAFAIHKPDKFFKEIVPKYFRQSRLSSFKRQLNLYGFELINTGPARGGYCHEMFVKDRPELCRKMRRVAIKLQAGKQHDNKEQNQQCGNSFSEEKNPIARDETLKLKRLDQNTEGT